MMRARIWWVSFAAWGGVAAFSVAQLAARNASSGHGTLRTGTIGLIVESTLLWGLLTPLIAAACGRWPLGRGSIVRHAALAFGLAFGDVVIDTPFVAWLAREPEGLWTRFFDELFINVFSYVAVSAICYALAGSRQLAARRQRDVELEAELLRARLDAMAARLHPHFLFNALNTIAALIRLGDREPALRAVVALSDLLRAALQSDGEAQIPLAREIDWIRAYLALEQLRFQDRLHVELAVAPEADTALVPALVLQPLVENAIRHGVEARVGGGQVAINAYRAGDTLRLEVTDTGRAPAAHASEGMGLGLKTTRARLEHLFGPAYSLELSAQGVATHAKIAIPFREVGA